ncbi:DUF1924 domain-containing protein [Sulfurimonas sp.]|uniref:DUF1924 domain-containing protein n=1 Tax=Sulfurimonas sp. TaxID=2022749 RepID=UPI002613F247|nr:DUF1924 domain-containing protein [Sulfurimonas sp.]
MKQFILAPLLVNALFAFDFNPQMQKYMQQLTQEAKKQNSNFSGFSYSRGEQIFTSKHIGKKGKMITCTSCHGDDLTQNGKNISTGKVIEPLSPSANPKRFTKVKSVKKWLRRNFRDVYTRTGTAQEKGDVITYIVNKK